MFLCCLVSSLSPIVFYQFYFQCFPLAGLWLRFLLIGVPPRPKTAWLVLRSVVPYRSLFFLPPLCASTLNWPLGPATLSQGSLILGYPSPAPPGLSLTGYFTAQVYFFRRPVFFRPDLITALSFWLRFLDRLFRRPLFPAQLCPTGYLGGRIALFAALLYTCVFPALLWSRLFGGSAIPPPSLLPPSLRPIPGATSGACSSVASPVGRLLDPFSCRLFDRSRGLGLFSTVRPDGFPFVIFLHIRGLRSSRHLGVGTRAPLVLPPPSWDLSAIGN